MKRLNRRETLLGLGLGAGLALTPAVAAPGTELAKRLLTDLAADPAPELAAFWRHPDSAHFFGRQYLAQYPDHADARRLAALIVADPADPLPEQVGRHIRADWDAGRQIRLSGCYMSLTEARLCALAALMA